MINTVYSQLCVGSLGDPLVNITFGQGTNPGGSLLAATTSYQYVTNDCPPDGFYTVRNNTSGCFGNSWHTVNADHTGNTGGYFMLVNASYQPGAFYLDTVRGLCANTTYEFAAWIMNVLLPSACLPGQIAPNLTLSIERTDGTLLQSYNTGNIVTTTGPLWKQYGFFFTTPVGVTDVVLRMVNNAPGGCGNDIALDDITFRPCGPLVTGTIDGIPDYDIDYCEGPSRQFILSCTVSGGFSLPVFQWQQRNAIITNWSDIPGANSNTFPAAFIMNATPGNYEFRLAVAESGNMSSTACRIYSQVFKITINANPVTTAVNDGPVCLNGTLNFLSSGGLQYAWTGPNGFTASGVSISVPNVQFTHTGKYYVTVTTNGGCTRLDSTIAIVNPVPTANVMIDADSICIKDSAQLVASGGIGYVWLPSAGLSNAAIANPKASPSQTTKYSVIVSNSFSCKDTATIDLAIIPKPIANAGPDKIIFQGQSTQLSASINGPGNSFSWSPATNLSNTNSLQPIANPPVDQIYTLTVVSGFGCGTASDMVLVKVFKDIYIPTAFTPNGDGLNDSWRILGLEALSSYRVIVYNRWGEAVFQIKDEPRSWDGTNKGVPMPAGVYVFFVEKGIEKKPVKGTLMLIR